MSRLGASAKNSRHDPFDRGADTFCDATYLIADAGTFVKLALCFDGCLDGVRREALFDLLCEKPRPTPDEVKRAKANVCGPLFLDGVGDPAWNIAGFVGERQVVDLEAEIFMREADGGDHPFAAGRRDDAEAFVPVESCGPVLDRVIDVVKTLAMLTSVV